MLEIIYLLFVMRQGQIVGKTWLSVWRERDSKKITPVQPHLKKTIMGRLFNYDFSNCKPWGFLWAFLIRTKQFVDRIYTTTKTFFGRSATNLVLTISLILTFSGIIVLLQLLANSFRNNVVITASYQGAEPADEILLESYAEEITRYEQIALMTQTYSTLQAINAFFIGLRILFDYGFSKELSLVLDLVGEAAFDILFFVLMFFLILFGFALNGYILFGLDTEQFRNIARSIG